jgi:4-amino-4-deoxy-L-arabinose transferase-like glycosyltransferase
MFSFSDTLCRIRRFFTASDILILVCLAGLYFATRLVNITFLPIFSDEGIYIHWARIAANDPAWRFISLTDGKQPLQTWGTIPLVKIFPDDLLLAGRLFSVTTGFFALLGTMVLCTYLWGKRTALFAGVLYCVTPFFLFYDRLALVDSGVNAAVIWILFLSIILARTMRLDVAIVLGIVGGLGLLTKSSVALLFALSAASVIMICNGSTYRERVGKLFDSHKKQLVDFTFLFAFAGSIAFCLYLTQKFFSPFFHYIGQKNLTFILSLHEWLSNPTQLWSQNITIVPLYIAWESGWALVPAGIFGIALLLRKQDPVGILLIVLILVPLIMIVNFNKVVFPRYLIFFPTLLLLGASYLYHHTNHERKALRHKSKLILLLTLVAWPALLSSLIIFAPTKASLPPIDRGQYITGKTAVWGAQDLMQTVRTQSVSQDKKAIILAEGNFGLIADVLEVFRQANDNIEIRGLWPLNESHILEFQRELPDNLVYIVFSHRTDFPVHWREFMTLIKQYHKPEGLNAVYLFQLIPKSL